MVFYFCSRLFLFIQYYHNETNLKTSQFENLISDGKTEIEGYVVSNEVFISDPRQEQDKKMKFG